MSQDDPLTRAIAIATHAHRNDRYGDHPYVIHLASVARVLRRYKVDYDSLVLAAWLHDTVEDTEVTIEQIRSDFGNDVAELVYAVTNEPGKNRRERNRRTYPKIAAVPMAVVLKLADRISNVEFAWAHGDSKLFMYQREYKEFRAALKPTKQHVPQEMWDHLDSLLGWREPS